LALGDRGDAESTREREPWEPDPVPEQEAARAPAPPPAVPTRVDPEPEPPAPVPIHEESRDETPVFELGSPGGNPTALAGVLLDAWFDKDPSELQSFLNEGEGNALPAARRTLVGCFWQSMVGRPESARERLEELDGADGVTSAQIELLRLAARDAAERAAPASGGRRDTLARAMQMILLDEHAERAADLGHFPLAAVTLSELIQAELAAPWPPHRSMLLRWAGSLERAQALHRLDPDGAWPAIEYVVRPNESPELVRKRVLEQHPNLKLCSGLIMMVNGVKKYIHPDQVLRIPTDAPNMLVDLDARLAIYRHGTEAVLAWEVGVGKEGHDTPIGTYYVGEKQENPPWFRPGEPPLPYGHPDNPLGERWIAWFQDEKKTSYGFHGTNDPEGVGGRVSQGCIRMRNEDVVRLFDVLPVGSAVIVQP
jgi:hypothetical protein